MASPAARTNDFSTGSVRAAILRMAVPITLAQLINILYNIVDRMYIGHIPGAGALALTGLGLCLPVISIVMAFARLSGMGGSPLCSIERGRGDLDAAEQIMGNSFTLLLIFAATLTLLGEIFLTPLLYAFGASTDTIGYAVDYARIYLAGNLIRYMGRKHLAVYEVSNSEISDTISGTGVILRTEKICSTTDEGYIHNYLPLLCGFGAGTGLTGGTGLGL